MERPAHLQDQIAIHPRDVKKGDTLVHEEGQAYWVAQGDAVVGGGIITCIVQFFPDGGRSIREWDENDPDIEFEIWR